MHKYNTYFEYYNEGAFTKMLLMDVFSPHRRKSSFNIGIYIFINVANCRLFKSYLCEYSSVDICEIRENFESSEEFSLYNGHISTPSNLKTFLNSR
jgi:hypothetical protein